MDRFDDIHQEPGAHALRRDANIRTHYDANGQRKDIVLEGKVISIAPDGSLDCANVSVAHFYHCKHPATDPIGSQCAEPGCANISCRACSANSCCMACLKPLCLEHLEQVVTPAGTLKFCDRCKAEHLKQQRKQAIIRFLLNPFVEFDAKKP
jgi:hypothetical protein